MVRTKELKGLSNEEASSRLKEYGYNTLENKKKVSPLKIFLDQFNDVIIWILIVATLISGIMGDKADAITILIIVIMNAILGFVQEYRTEKSLDALKELASPTAKVIRSEKLQVINSINLVPGDLIILESGDRVPADSIIFEGSGIMVDESLLTGESVGVYKSIENGEDDLFMGTIMLAGRCRAKVISTGMNTEMGKIADMLHSIEEDRSPLKERLNSLGKILVVLCLAICAVVTFLGIWRGEDPYEMFLSGVSLAVAAIPEGLSAIVTVALALGVSRMLKRKALVRRLPAVETLGCTSIICSDKTGTLTENKMTLKAIYFDGNIMAVEGDKVKHNILRDIFANCNDCEYDYFNENIERAVSGDPTEIALIKGFFQRTSDIKSCRDNYRRVHEIQFNSTRKMMTVVMDSVEGKRYVYTKGAPEKVLDKCNKILIKGKVENLTQAHRRSIEKTVDEMSFKALRCIAGAYLEEKQSIPLNDNVERGLIFVGVAGIIDPPRKEVKDAVRKCKSAGIVPMMITGDHKNTAFAIGKELNICNDINEVITGPEIEMMSDNDFEKSVERYRIFARVTPKHKLRIVKALKAKNKVVAMTGDGVNDAPAVKEADIGIAMGISGTDVTKEAAAMILLDDNFSTIVAAVEEGRVIYYNIRKFIRYLLSCNLGEVLTMFLSSLFYLETPLLPIQILFINLVTDGLPAIALGIDPSESDIMDEKPREKNEGVFSHGLKEKILIRGALIGTCTILAFLAGKYYGYNLEVCRTLALGTLICSQLIHVFECRSEKHSLFEINPFTNMYLLGAVTVSVVALLIVMYNNVMQGIFHTAPLTFGQWMIVIFLSGIIAFTNSLYLFIGNKKNK